MVTIFRNAKIITGTGDLIRKGLIILEGPKIRYAGLEKTVSPSKKDQVFDLSGMTVLPGLIDCHVHLCMDGSPGSMASLLKDTIALHTLKTAHHARLTLVAGITTIRDLGGRDYVDIAVRNEIRSGLLQGPRMLCSGKMICMTGGYGWWYSREVRGSEDVRKAVREQIQAGADVIKLMATGGILSRGPAPGAAELNTEELRAGVEEAREAGKRTASHAQGKKGIMNSLRAGIDSIEHGVFLDHEAIDLMLKSKSCLVPTLSPPYRILKGGVKAGIPSSVVKRAKTAMKNHLDSVTKAYDAGVPIAMGTDAGTPLNPHGENLKELELLLMVGLSPMEAIVSATKTASEVLGLQGKIGTLEKGKLADLVVVDGDPLDDITVLQKKDRIRAILKEGRFFKNSLNG